MSKPPAKYFLDLADRLIKGDILPKDVVAQVWQNAADHTKEEKSAMSDLDAHLTEICYRCKRVFPASEAKLVACSVPGALFPKYQPFCPECFEWFESTESEEKS